MWMQDGCRVYVDSYMASNGSCCMVTWTTFKNRFLEVGLTPNRETMALRMLATVDLSCFIMCEGLHEIEIHWNCIWLRPQSHLASHYTWGSVRTLHDSGGVLGRPWDTFFWALTISSSWLVCEVALNPVHMYGCPWVVAENIFLSILLISWIKLGMCCSWVHAPVQAAKSKVHGLIVGTPAPDSLTDGLNWELSWIWLAIASITHTNCQLSFFNRN